MNRVRFPYWIAICVWVLIGFSDAITPTATSTDTITITETSSFSLNTNDTAVATPAPDTFIRTLISNNRTSSSYSVDDGAPVVFSYQVLAKSCTNCEELPMVLSSDMELIVSVVGVNITGWSGSNSKTIRINPSEDSFFILSETIDGNGTCSIEAMLIFPSRLSGGNQTVVHSVIVTPQGIGIAAPGFNEYTLFEGRTFEIRVVVDIAPGYSVPSGGYIVAESDGNLTGEGVHQLVGQNTVSFLLKYNNFGSFILTFTYFRSDGTEMVSEHNATVFQQPPFKLEPSGVVECLAKIPMAVQPSFTMITADGNTYDYPVTATLRLSRSNPDHTYDDKVRTSHYRNSWAFFGGVNQADGTHVISSNGSELLSEGLWIDRSGIFDITATIVLPNGVVMLATEVFRCHSLPSYSPPADAKVNSRLRMTFYGVIPFNLGGSVVVSKSPNCSGVSNYLTEVFYYPREPISYSIVYSSAKNASLQIQNDGTLLPFQSPISVGIEWVLFNGMYAHAPSDSAYVCFRVESSDVWVNLWQYYVQRHDEPFPITRTFPIAAQNVCPAILTSEATEYQIAEGELRWEDVTPGRRYGCRQVPPVDGSVPPCFCPSRFLCRDYHATQGDRTVNLGICECCETWFLAVMFCIGGLCFALVSYFIVFKL